MIFKQHRFENPHNLNQHQLWLIATSALLSQFNKQRHDTLLPLGDNKTKEVMVDITSCLQRDWGIKTKAGLIKTLKIMPQKDTFTGISERWGTLSQLELSYFNTDGKQSSVKNIFKMIDFYQFDLGKSGDLAWHFGRNAWLIRQGALIHLLTEEEAWDLLEENGKFIRDSFESWEQFGSSYTVGAQYWLHKDFTESAIKRFKDTLTFLLINKDSPWYHIPFPESRT